MKLCPIPTDRLQSPHPWRCSTSFQHTFFFLIRLIIDRIETVNCCHGALAAGRGNNTPRSDAYTVALKPAQAVPLACTPPQLVCSGSSRRAGLCSWVWIWALEPRTLDRCDLSCTILILIKQIISSVQLEWKCLSTDFLFFKKKK